LPFAAAGPSIHRFPTVPTVIVEEFGDRDAEEAKTGRAAWLMLLLTIALLGGGGYFGYMYYWQPQQQKEQAAARESARAAQVQAEKDRAAALARSKAIEEARAKIAQETKSADEGPSSQAASPPDGAVNPPSSSDAAGPGAKKDTLSGTAERASRPEPPRNFDYYMTQGYRHLEKRSPTLAVEAFGKAADLRPDRAEPFGGRGLALLKMGDLTQAESSFQEALKLNPNFGIAVIGLAKTYLSQGKKDKAADYYGKYLEILPDGPEANGAKLALKRLRQE
jgi:tetratricopeptide (TPR) repeat protein